MKLLIISIASLFFQSEYNHQIQNKDFYIQFNYVEVDDTKFMKGHIQFKSNNKNAINTNIRVIDYKIGTVPKLDGTFKIRLPEDEDKILIHNHKHPQFKFKYKFEKDSLRDFTY